MVQAARIQQVIQGDDAVFTHEILGQAVVGNNETLIPVNAQTGDTVTAVYQPEDPLHAVISIVGVPVGSLPTNKFTFTLTPAQTALLLPGQGQTARIEIVRVTSLLKETHYVYNEYDVLARGFPVNSNATLP